MRLEKKCWLENFWTFPAMQDRKTVEVEKNPLRLRGQKKKVYRVEIFHCWLGKQCRLEVLGSNPGGFGYESREIFLGSNPGGPGGSGFESLRDQYLNRRNKPQFLSPNEPKRAQMCPKLVFFGQNPVFPAKNRRQPFFSAKIEQHQFFRSILT